MTTTATSSSAPGPSTCRPWPPLPPPEAGAERLGGLAGELLARLSTGGRGLLPLSQPFPGHPGAWLWEGGGDRRERLVVKHACRDDGESLQQIRREATVLAALSPTGVVPALRLELREGGELTGFAIAWVEACPEIEKSSALAHAAFAAALARLHAHGLRAGSLENLDVPLALGGHTLFIGGAEILAGLCRQLDGGPHEPLATLARPALAALIGARERVEAHFPPEEMLLVHGDIAGGNLIFRRQGPVVGCVLLDLGEVVVAPPQYDLARYALGAKLTPEGEDLLLTVYGSHFHLATGRELPAAFRAGFEIQKTFAVFDTAIAPYVIYAAHGLPLELPPVLERMERALGRIRSEVARW